jgi:hypothetical protein
MKEESTMTTHSGGGPNEQDKSRTPKERGGASDIDRSKGFGTEEDDSPVGGSGGDSGTKKEPRDG